MRRLISIFLGLGLIGSNGYAEAMKTVQKFSFDWDMDGKPDQFEFKLPINWDDPGEYRTLTIDFANKRHCQIALDAGSSNSPTEGIHSNLVTSKLATVINDNQSPTPILMLRNWTGGSSPNEALFYEIKKDGKDCPKLIWKSEVFIQHLQERSGNLSLVINRGTQILDDQTKTYDPTLVYRIKKNKSGELLLDMDETESETRNLSDNYPWKGPKASGYVFFPKPIFTDPKDLNKLKAFYGTIKNP